MADFVDGLSDAELRTKLAEYGFPVVPITATTRKVMTKKLKLLIENKNKSNSEGRRSLSKYSSEEESDTDVKQVVKDKNRRKTVAGVMQPPSSITKSRKSTRIRVPGFETPKEDVPPSPVVNETRTSTRRTTRVTKQVVEDNDFETGSDSEPEIIEPPEEPEVKSPTPSYKSYSPRVTITKITEDNDKSSVSTRDDKTSVPTRDYKSSNDYISPRTTTSRYSTFSHSTINDGSDAAEKLNQIRSRLSLGSSISYDRPSTSYTSTTDRKYGSVTNYEGGDTSVETPFLSNFTKRLSQLSTSPKTDYNYKNDIIKEHDANGSSYNRLYLNRTRRRDYPQDFKTSQEKSIFKNNFISLALPVVFLLFFFVIFIMYMGIKTDNLPVVMDTSDYILPACGDGSQSKPGINCVPQSEITDALNLLKVVLPELTKRAINYHCSSTTVMPFMTDAHIQDHLARNYAYRAAYDIQKDINNLQVFIFKNQKWGISIINSEEFPNVVKPMENMDQIISNRDMKNLAMIILKPDIPWKCYIFNKLYTIISSLLVVGIGFLFIIGVQKSYKYYLMKKKRHNDQIYWMVEKIIDILQSNVADNNDNYLAVNHVRDMIIPPQERKQMSSIWDGAVKFLAENESRVRTEIQIVSGEEFHVWRWLGNPNMNLSGSPKSKIWQGQAFETQVGSVNSLPCSPTPCLKIRGMFDKSERNHFTIREAVLNKCASKCKILHCEVDPNTDCVYLKCADQKEAATAYRNLHGWWCDGHLVTVKYLRLERYMQRFPDSPTKGPPFLQASTTVTTNDWTNEDD